MVSAEKPSLLLTFDIEDWFQVENFKSHIQFSTWNSLELRVEKNTILILDLLDSFSFKPRATFFVLGWVAEKCPRLVREISNRGHEVASHGYGHDLCPRLDKDLLLQDLHRSKVILEEITGKEVVGYRAPSFSVNDAVLAMIQDAGYLYDASYNSFSAHGRYGRLDLSNTPKKQGVYQLGEKFFELPVSNLRLFNHILPLGGGGYFRLLPFFIFQLGIAAVLKKENGFLFYAHPWEFDPDQPRVNLAESSLKFRHYVNLSRTKNKMEAMIARFSSMNFKTALGHIQSVYP
ncbi:MAG: DUF3473 domain-containing protein [Proteobacteria bacterium]|nr:DUF3473 domain-containing protein [Pseudomonadota bacterium]